MGRWCPVVFLLVQIACAYQPYSAGDSALAKKCERLKLKTTSSFYGRSCFVTTSEAYTTNLADWPKLHKRCNELTGYNGRLAFIRTRAQIQALVNDEVIEEHGSYFIGAKQDPPSGCRKGEKQCIETKHQKNWYYVDGENVKQGELNSMLWLSAEPNNDGIMPPENIVTLERLTTTRLGFNDVSGKEQNFRLLCEYEDILECPENYTLIGKNCYKAFPEEVTPAEAKDICAKNGGGTLASIHNDQLNGHLSNMGRLAKDLSYFSKRYDSEQFAPFLIGLEWLNEEWKWNDATDTDYYRWYANAKGSIPLSKKPSEGYRHVVLQTSTNTATGEGGFAYWSVMKPGEKASFFCQTKPKVN